MQKMQNVNYSYWELDQYFKSFDLIVIGSGIVGLSTAISFREKNKKAQILVLEKGILPSGASTKNAGFACFGSPTELLDDLKNMNEKNVWETVLMRWKGLEILRKRLGDKNMDFKPWGGYELFDSEREYEFCLENLDMLNRKISATLHLKNTYSDFKKNIAQFKGIKGVILNRHEGQINTGNMMQNLISLAQEKHIRILNGISISAIHDESKQVKLQSDAGTFTAKKVVVATNGFAKQLLDVKDVKPARAQVLITKPIKNLKLKGTFHYHKGYYYFRNINDRILFGGGRNLEPETETTTEIALNENIQKNLDILLKEMILPGVKYEVEHRWSGIMGVGNEKKPIIEFVSKNVLAAVRMGGMGVAIGSLVGEIAAKKIKQS
jgi:glycine/D-amino acid oxidase-like deaminating enzyme